MTMRAANSGASGDGVAARVRDGRAACTRDSSQQRAVDRAPLCAFGAPIVIHLIVFGLLCELALTLGSLELLHEGAHALLQYLTWWHAAAADVGGGAQPACRRHIERLLAPKGALKCCSAFEDDVRRTCVCRVRVQMHDGRCALVLEGRSECRC